MTCEIKTALAAALLSLAQAGAIASAPSFAPTQEITSNNGYSLAGHGDTLWMVTDGGINYTMTATDSFSWSGYASGNFNGAMCFGDGRLLACLWGQGAPGNSQVTSGQFWLFRQAANNYSVIDPGFSRDGNLGAINNSADFSGVCAAWSRGAFWVACRDGGLVRLDTAGGSVQAFFPGRKAGFAPSAITSALGASLNSFPDTAQRVIAVAVQDTSAIAPVLWVATPAKVWKFQPRDSLWDSASSALADTHLSFVQYFNVWAGLSGDSLMLFAVIEANRAVGASAPDSFVDDTALFVYDSNGKSWHTCLQGVPSALAFGSGRQVYVAMNGQVSLCLEAKDSLATSIDGTVFQNRMTAAAAGIYPDNINDILYLAQPGGKAQFWIATSTTSNPTHNGLFYSFDEAGDERRQPPAAFGYLHRDPKIKNGLAQSYAYPSILNANPSNATAVFAYSLSKTSKVTIRIYDWNMDMVKTVIRDADRPAGNDNANGRSTNAAQDVWNGTNSAGQRVAVGVYYYKISAQSGEHAFGKIIVAR